MVSLDTTQQVSVSVQPVDAKGHNSTVDGVPTWDSSPAGIVTLDPASDGLSCMIKGTAEGNCVVTVSADADLTPSVKTISAALAITVTKPMATDLVITIGQIVGQSITVV